MDVRTKYNNLIEITKEEAPWSSCISDLNSELSEFDLSECTKALNNLIQALPKERKPTLLTMESVVMEAADYALELQQKLKEREDNSVDVSCLKNKEKTLDLKSGEEIKRPKNGFIRFAMKYRTEVSSEYPNLDNRHISCLLGMRWKKMSEEERKPYEEEFKKDMQLLRDKHPNWMYTPKKTKMEEDLDTKVLPTRLRPQEKRKRKVLDCYEEFYPTTTRRKSKPQSGCKRRPRKKKTEILKENPSKDFDINWDLFNGILVDTSMMPTPCGPLNLMNEFDWENQLEFMFEHSTHPWLQNDACNIKEEF